MEAQRRDRWKVWTPLFFSIVLVLGMVLGFNLKDTLRSKRDIATVIQRNDRLEEIIDLINDKYVDSVSSNKLYGDAVDGILKSLDPHTVYIPAEDLQGVNEDLEGGFSGIGIEFSIVRDTIQVTSVVDGGPASKVGIDVGDELIKVGDTLVAGNNINSDRIVQLLKGKQQSKVILTIKGSADGRLKQVPITRDIVPIYSVEANLMVDSVTGFIKINRFSANTHDEFAAALKKLKSQGARQLIIDLRDNPGGYVDAATAIADDLLDDGKLIVYTQGTRSSRTEYKATKGGLFERGKVAVLIDESSASASEILAGAIQDWDRGIIVGRRSFGKGLVQEQYDLPDGSALRLTIAKYYTPSGRCIQRSYAKGREAYLEDYEKRFEPAELAKNDTDAVTDTVPFFTSHHRAVYGGGGIKPDVYIPYDTSRLSAALLNVVFSQELKTAVWDYFLRNRQKLKFKDIADFNRSFNAPDQVAGNYIASLSADTRKGVLQELSNPANQGYFKLQIKAQLARILFKDNGYYSVSLKEDEVVNKALNALNSNQYSQLISGK